MRDGEVFRVSDSSDVGFVDVDTLVTEPRSELVTEPRSENGVRVSVVEDDPLPVGVGLRDKRVVTIEKPLRVVGGGENAYHTNFPSTPRARIAVREPRTMGMY